MSNFDLCNLQMRSNLLPPEYQCEFSNITVWELKDIRRRCPLLDTRPAAAQQKAWTAWLLSRDKRVSMDDDDRRRAWLERLAEKMDGAIASLKVRSDVERAFELLCVAESRAAPALDSHLAAKALIWAKETRSVLQRPEFKLTRQMIDDRLALILGAEGGPRPNNALTGNGVQPVRALPESTPSFA